MTMTSRAQILKLTTAAIVLTMSAMAGQAAAEDLAMSIAGTGEAGRIEVVTGSDGKKQISTGTLGVPVKMHAVLAETSSRHRIVASAIELRTAGSNNSSGKLAVSPDAATSELTGDTTHSIPLAADSELARAAISACNAGQGARSLKVDLVWKVTTGRFNYRWRDYDRLPPSEATYADPDFYTEREVSERVVPLTVPVDCDGRREATPIAVLKPTPPVAKPKIEDPVQATHVASVVEPAVMACDGGLLRESDSGESVCLCPGNTVRASKPDGGYICARKFRRQ